MCVRAHRRATLELSDARLGDGSSVKRVNRMVALGSRGSLHKARSGKSDGMEHCKDGQSNECGGARRVNSEGSTAAASAGQEGNREPGELCVRRADEHFQSSWISILRLVEPSSTLVGKPTVWSCEELAYTGEPGGRAARLVRGSAPPRKRSE
jgi:hypothetical protein